MGGDILTSITAAAPSHPHPAAPPEWQMSFSDLTQKPPSPPSPQDHPVFMEFWEAPARFSKPSSRYLEQVEIDAILVSIPVRHLIQYSSSCRVGELLSIDK
jgi:hypothetical protein